MAMRSGVSWPTSGDAVTFRRRACVLFASGVAIVAICLAAASWHDTALVRPLVPLAASALLLLGLWTHGSARRAARRAEVERSFAGLRVLHQGRSYTVAAAPLAGEYPTRRDAARAAIDRGSWALVVHAWDRYYVLACTPVSTGAGASRAPVAFRSRAVADVVPGISDGLAVGA